MNSEELEHDVAEDGQAFPGLLAEKAVKRPKRDKMVHQPPAGKTADMRHELGRANKPWLSADNPAIWDGEIDE